MVTSPRPTAEGGDPVTEPTLYMPVEQCQELLVELQQLRLRLTALEQVVANAVQVGEQAQQLSSQAGG
jgi:hypothetical protein